MKIPAFLIGFAVIFWGLETDRFSMGCLLAATIESTLFIRARYRFGEEEFVKISDLTSIIFLASLAFALLNYEAIYFLRITTGWLPLILAPLMVAQQYSVGDSVVIGTRIGRKSRAYMHKPFDFRPYYLFICLFAAATGNTRSDWFFLMMAACLAVLLFANRGRFHSPYLFGLLLAGTVSAGYLGGMGLHAGHRYVMYKSFSLLRDYYRSQMADPFKAHVNFGDTGSLKYSGRIIMRLSSSSPPPALLKEAVYHSYSGGSWFGNTGGSYSPLELSGSSQWNLIAPPHREGGRVDIEMNMPREKGLLPIPYGGYRLNSATIIQLEQHHNGSIKVMDGAPLLTYEIHYHPAMRKKSYMPGPENLQLPEKELYVLAEVRTSLKVADASGAAAIKAVKDYFAHGFSYSLQMLGRGNYATPLGNFLLREKRGFCEYYATATALLLRSMHIPSRYVIGYAVAEKSGLEGKYIVRDRHAHAWAEAFVDGRWQAVDTTPAGWFAEEAENASVFEVLQDLLSFVRHRYSLLQLQSETDYQPFFLGLVAILTLILGIRIYRRVRGGKASPAKGGDIRSFPRIVTPLTPVLDRLTSIQGPPENGESVIEWAARYEFWQSFNSEEFASLHTLHLKFRFDPKIPAAWQKEQLEKGAEKYLAELEKGQSYADKKTSLKETV